MNNQIFKNIKISKFIFKNAKNTCEYISLIQIIKKKSKKIKTKINNQNPQHKPIS